MLSRATQRTREVKNRMLEICTSGSVGGLGGQPPRPTRPTRAKTRHRRVGIAHRRLAQRSKTVGSAHPTIMPHPIPHGVYLVLIRVLKSAKKVPTIGGFGRQRAPRTVHFVRFTSNFLVKLLNIFWIMGGMISGAREGSMRQAIVVILIVGSGVASAQAADPVDYDRDIRPILAKRCLACHGPEKQRAGLRLDGIVVPAPGG